MAELAPGPASGYIYQFELALATVAGLGHPTDVVSLEKVDDVAVQNEDDLVTLSIQSKHSISPNGTTFEDTSKALWRTIEIWIQKLNSKELDHNTIFITATNKKIVGDALVRKIKDEPIDAIETILKELLDDQKEKLKVFKKKDPAKGGTIAKTIQWIEFALTNWDKFHIIKNNLEIWDSNFPKLKFLNSVHMSGSEYSETSKDNVYHSMLGWMTENSKAKWMQGKDASFSKAEFETKLFLIRSTPSLLNAVFRKKINLGTLEARDIEEKRSELFVRQIEDIKRRKDAKEKKVEEAIINFLYHDIEVSHILKKGNITKVDFDEFREKCKKRWETCFDSHVKQEIEEYTEDQRNELAISIYDEIMDNIEVKFMEDHSFNADNRYIHNGAFLKLSNLPEIGWHPEWKSKYIK